MSQYFFEKYLHAMPYTNIWIAEDNINCFFLKDVGDSKKLHFLDLNISCNLENAKLILDEDFNKRSFSTLKYFPENKQLYFVSDTDNKEDFNVYRLTIGTNKITKITDSVYCGVSGINDDILVYSNRYKVEKGLFFNEINYINLKTNEKNTILKDDCEEYRFNWGEPCFSYDGKYILLPVDKENRRQKCNIVRINIETGHFSKLLKTNEETSNINVLSKHFSEKGFLYVSNIDGFDNVYHYDFEFKTSKILTGFNSRNNGISLKLNGEKADAIVAAIPESELDKTEIHYYKLTASENEVTHKIVQAFDGPYFVASRLNTLWLSHTSYTEPSIRQEYVLEDNELTKARKINLYHGNRDAIVHSSYKFIKYPSFDGLEIPSFLVIPGGKIRGALIKAFYGGNNYYDYNVQMLSETGIATLSPAVRGSWGFGKEWEKMLKGDLGGNEILDLVWAAKFLEKELDLKPQHIGLEGASHGGYAVLRALTMPEKFNNQNSKYPFGFGICAAGFADLVDFYNTSNIPDWLVDLLGPFKGNEGKYRDRSPINHFDELQSPVFIVHGTNDSRVSSTSITGFLEKLKQSKNPHVIHFIEGQGHSSGSKDEKLIEYKKMFDFLDEFLFTKR